ncbi:D-aminoacyl-tRNA deacylase, partial [Nocardia cyriacigeorgica]|uniref:D-aminoacyl-tRNA deacylase n=1 Tax=Nocardia cyriacigeorgica TaxID=135487 RepID=UPI002453C7C8
MRVLLQRVTSARVSVDGEVVGRIDPAAHGAPHGLVALVGVTHDDTEAAAAALADKLWRLRVLDGERSAADLDAPILVVSQFTLYADTKKGRRPSWSARMNIQDRTELLPACSRACLAAEMISRRRLARSRLSQDDQ